ncbi:MAG TPA: ATP-binding protein [Vicinamibacteria bacterium]|nr:ATP-binding protein [Vicinamibacteria bacterium]
MRCARCGRENNPQAHRCAHCGASLSIALLEVVRGELPESAYFLKPRPYTVGRGRQNDLWISEPSISKVHARILHEGGVFTIADNESLHGVFVNGQKVSRAELTQGALIQLGNVTLRFSLLGADGGTQRIAEFPWIEQQQLLLSLVQAVNSTLDLEEVLEQVLDAVVRITRAERGFLFLADGEGEGDAGRYPLVEGLRLRVARRRDEPAPLDDVQGVSTSVLRRAMLTGETIATSDAQLDPSLAGAQSVILGELRTIVCIPLRPRPPDEEESAALPLPLGALYVDNQETSAPFSPESLRTAEALARHAALAIQNARLYDRERRTTAELRRAQAQLLQSEKLATIGQMAAGIAHELNTPLTYIVGNLELLQAEPLSGNQKEMLASAEKGAARIKTLAENLLAFSRPAGEEMVPLSVNELVERSVEFCSYQVLKAGVEIEKTLDPSAPRVSAIANQLETAFINLIMNAVQAMPGEGGRVLVSTSARDAKVEITVSDTGPGIPPEIQQRIFEPFFTTKEPGKGTGLGLSNVLIVVESHGGRIDLSSEPGAGATFRITLPAAKEEGAG